MITFQPRHTDIYSGSADYASGLRVIGAYYWSYQVALPTTE